MKFLDFKKEYEKIANGKKIPTLEELDAEFSIQYDINKLDETPNNITNFVISNIINFYNGYLNWCYNLKFGNPQSGIINQESSFLSDKEKNELMKVLYKITAISRISPGIYLENKENKVEVIKNLYDEWIEIKPFLRDLSEKVRIKWQESYESFDPKAKQF
ncbi:MAG: hypothetical protein ACMXX7_00025 [Candidatus Woesearchaeota archaeon]